MFLAVDSGGALSLDLSPVDLVLMIIYFSFVLGIGFALKRAVKSSLGKHSGGARRVTVNAG